MHAESRSSACRLPRPEPGGGAPERSILAQLPEELRYLSLPAGSRLRAITASLAGAGVLAVVVFAILRPRMELEHVFAEEGAMELFHPWAWALCGTISAIGCLRGEARRDVWFFFWTAFLALIAGMRELDLHVVVNPDNIHYLSLSRDHAVHFRIDWWLSAETGVLTRLVWGTAFLVLATGFFLPLVLARVRWKRLVLGLDSFALTFGAACGFLGLGYVMDDIILRLFQTPPAWGQRAEELSETVGVLLLACALALAVREGHHARAMRRSKPVRERSGPGVSAGA